MFQSILGQNKLILNGTFCSTFISTKALRQERAYHMWKCKLMQAGLVWKRSVGMRWSSKSPVQSDGTCLAVREGLACSLTSKAIERFWMEECHDWSDLYFHKKSFWLPCWKHCSHIWTAVANKQTNKTQKNQKTWFLKNNRNLHSARDSVTSNMKALFRSGVW